MSAHRTVLLGATAALALALYAGASPAPTSSAGANPFAHPSTLPLQAPPFDKIKDSDYQPGIEEA